MRFPFGYGMLATVDVQYHPKMKIQNHELEEPRRSTKIKITVIDSTCAVRGVLEGVARCQLRYDAFDKFEGRKRALRRAFDSDPMHELLPKECRAAIVEAMLLPSLVRRSKPKIVGLPTTEKKIKPKNSSMLPINPS